MIVMLAQPLSVPLLVVQLNLIVWRDPFVKATWPVSVRVPLPAKPVAMPRHAVWV
jgi:hypothetical protein